MKVIAFYIIYYPVLYNIGEECDRVFIIKNGKASVETFIEINDENTYPIVRI